jgi:hypothetical protein
MSGFLRYAEIAVSYLTVRELKTRFLEQLTETAEHDGALQFYLDAATGVIDLELGYTYIAAAPDTEIVYGDGTTSLMLPAHTTGSVTTVTAPSSYSVPSAYVEYGGDLWVTDSSGVLTVPRLPRLSYEGWYGQVWQQGVPYTVTASFGHGAAEEPIKYVCGEIAVQMWRRRDSGGTEVLGVEGASAVSIRNSLSPLARSILDAAKAGSDKHIGVW